jgi:hypothetical protein
MNTFNLKPVVYFLAIVFTRNLYAADDATLKFEHEIEVGAAILSHQNQNFGADESFYGNPVSKDGTRFEWYLRPEFKISKDTDKYESVLTVAPLASGTYGDVDALVLGKKDTADIALEQLSLNTTVKNIFGITGWDQSLLLGKQQYQIGSYFVLGNGHLMQGKSGSTWIARNKSFDWTSVLRSTYENWKFDLFHLKGTFDFDAFDLDEKMKLTGFNAEYSTEKSRVGGVYFSVDDNANEYRDGLKVRNFYLSQPLSFISDRVKLELDYAHQSNSGNNEEGYAARLNYTFENTKFTPKISYRWSKFSSGYDALTYGSTGEWGDWFQGEIIGSYMLFNTNQLTQSVKLELYPAETYRLGAVFYDHDNYDGDKRNNFAQELNLYFDYYPSERFFTGLILGVAKPQTAAKQHYQHDDTSLITEAYITYKF